MTDNITLPRATVQQALDALLWADAQGQNWQQVVKKAIKPIQEAAAQPEPVQEPFGYLWPTGSHPEFRFTQQKRDGADGMPLYTAPPQQQAEPVLLNGLTEAETNATASVLGLTKQAEPVAWNKSIRDSVDLLLEQAGYQPDSSARHQLAMMNFDSAPPQRKPLTDEEIEQAQRDVWRSLPSDFDYTTSSWIEIGIRYAEAAHGIKEGT